MKVCIDPGHGMSNRQMGIYDSGAVHTENGFQFQEATIVLQYCLALKDVFRTRQVDVFMTRDDATDHTPVGARALMARSEGSDVLISFHLNDSDDDTSNGLEVLYRDSQSKVLARKLQDSLLKTTEMRDRKIKQRTDLAVLKFEGLAVIIELGFIANDSDREKLINVQVRKSIVTTIANVVIEHFGQA